MSPVVLAVIAAAISPALFLMYFVYSRDRIQRESKRVILRIFLLSSLSVIPAAILELPVMLAGALIGPAIGLGIGLIEEAIKFFAVRRLAYRRIDFDEPFDGIVFAVAVSLGFATVENLLYILPAYFSGQFVLQTILIRALVTVPMHALVGVMMGYYIGRAKFAEEGARKGLLWRSILIPSAVHGVFDVFVFAAAAGQPLLLVAAVLTVAIAGAVALGMMRRSNAMSPFLSEATPDGEPRVELPVAA